VDLEPVVRNLVREFGYHVALINWEEGEEGSYDDEGEGSPWWAYSTTWVLLARDGAALKSPAIQSAAIPLSTNTPAIPLWTDDFASLFQVLQ
jgi:hypothetical protein